MTPYVHAKSAPELRAKLDFDWDSIKHRKDITDAEWYERAQLKAFLNAVAEREFFDYPVEIVHTSASKPDFKLAFLNSAVGIEDSRIAHEQLNRLNHLHHSGKTPEVVAISHALVSGERMTNDDLITQTLPGGQWNAALQERDFWLTQATTIIHRKTRIRRSNDYQDYGENWLVL